MNPNPSSRFFDIVQPLHAHSQQQLIDRARHQFAGSNEAFEQLLTDYAALAPRAKAQLLTKHGVSSGDDASSTGTSLSLAVSEATGLFLRQMVLALRPTVVLELGSSCGVSTLYVADALRRLGQGRVIATELDPGKIEQLQANLARAGLSRWVDVRQGDVMQTLATLQAPVDLAFIDIWATGYLDAFKHLRPLLRPGSVVLTDNMFTAAKEVRAFKQYLEQHASLSTVTLDFESGLEFTVMGKPLLEVDHGPRG